ncbi:hypothetical protein LINPERHAP1_LOCUS37337, partial [Linum perenne]
LNRLFYPLKSEFCSIRILAGKTRARSYSVLVVSR